MTRLDDPLGAPPIDPAAVRQRARELQRRRTGATWAGVAGGALVLALVVTIARPDAVRVDTGPNAAATPPSACEPAHQVTRSLIVLAGATPDDNEQIAKAVVEILQDVGFGSELRSRLDADVAGRFSAEAITAAISASRRPDSPIVQFGVRAASAADAEQISDNVIPTLTSVTTAGQRNLPIEQRLPGPLFEEVPEPTSTDVPC